LSSKTPYVMLATTGDIVMIRKELLGIKARAERRVRRHLERRGGGDKLEEKF